MLLFIIDNNNNIIFVVVVVVVVVVAAVAAANVLLEYNIPQLRKIARWHPYSIVYILLISIISKYSGLRYFLFNFKKTIRVPVSINHNLNTISLLTIPQKNNDGVIF